MARVDDPSAAWFNPAGLSRQATAQISGSSGMYQHTLVAPEALPNRGGSIQQLPNIVGFTFVPRKGLTVGAALVSTNAWDQQTDSELFSTAAAGEQRFAYSADSAFEQRILAVSVGYQRTGSWRFGGGFAFSLMNLRLVQSASDRIVDASGLRSLLVSSRASGSALQLRTQGGAQYDIGNWRFGLALRSPGLMLHKTGSLLFDGVLASDPHRWALRCSTRTRDSTITCPGSFMAARHSSRRASSWSSTSRRTHRSRRIVALVRTAGVPVRGCGAERAASRGLAFVRGPHVRIGKRGQRQRRRPRASAERPRLAGSCRDRLECLSGRPSDVVFNKVDLTTWSIGVSGTLGDCSSASASTAKSGVPTMSHCETCSTGRKCARRSTSPGGVHLLARLSVLIRPSRGRSRLGRNVRMARSTACRGS